MGTVYLQDPDAGCRTPKNPCPKWMPDDCQMVGMPTADRYFLIHLADDEWGNEKMQEVAAEFFAAHPAAQFVEVHEHAGWYLGFRRDLTVWCTANDGATLTHPEPQPTGGMYGYIRRH